ncbi:MAG TPA: hypothetical protein PK095_21975 [Myxococcota bacterium]|nr:hypothetical protein [Myxococcota bacterium]
MTWPALTVVSALVLFASALGSGGCGEDEAGPCRVAADCASGICLPDGRCALFPEGDGEVLVPETTETTDGETAADGADIPEVEPGDTDVTADTDPTDTAGAPDSSDTPDTDGANDTSGPDTTGTCLPQGDGRVTRAEVPIAPGLQATFLVASDVDFDTRGDAQAAVRWDLEQSFAGDTKVLVTTLDPSDTWYGPLFPSATYATRLAEGQDLLGVFEAKDDGLYLLGVVSPDDGLFRTELTYDPPAKLMAYPLELDTSWTSTSSVSGLTSGVVTFASETYEGLVDARGVLSTPFADFDALRVILTLDRWVGAALYFDVSHLFVTECFGTVATLRSEAYVSGPEMTTLGELRRLSP